MIGSRLRAADRLWTLQFQRRLWSKLTIGMEIAGAIAHPGQSPLVGYIFVLPPPEPEAIDNHYISARGPVVALPKPGMTDTGQS